MKNKEVTDFQAHTPELRQLYSRHSSKWRRFSADVLPMHVAEMDFEIAEPIRSQLARMVTESDLGYLGPVPEVAAAFEKFAATRWGWKIDPAQLKLATDVGVATVEYLRANLQPGERVVITSPVYSGFFEWLKELNIEPFDVPLAHTEQGWRLDLRGLEQAFAQGHLTLLLCNPHNPVGRAFDRQELTALAELAARYGATVISDEIHAPLTYGDSEFIPFLAVSENARKVGITITSSSKSWNTAGLKAAIVITASDEMQAVVARTPEAMHWRASLLGAFAMVESYEHSEGWLDETVATLDGNRHFTIKQFAEKLPQARVSVPASTYLAWVDVSDCGFGDNPAAYLLENAKVGVDPGTNFGKQYKGFVRFNFATSHENIAEAISRMAAAAN